MTMRESFQFTLLSGVAIVTLVGFVFNNSRNMRVPVPQERPHPAVLVAQAVPGPMQLLKPVIDVSALPVEVNKDETEEGDAFDLDQSPTLDLMLGEFDALIQGVEAGRMRNARHLNGYFSGRLSDIRKAGGSFEDIEGRLDRFFRAVEAQNFLADEVSWLKTERDLQRDRFVAIRD